MKNSSIILLLMETTKTTNPQPSLFSTFCDKIFFRKKYPKIPVFVKNLRKKINMIKLMTILGI
jgi:hypothetical protein